MVIGNGAVFGASGEGCLVGLLLFPTECCASRGRRGEWEVHCVSGLGQERAKNEPGPDCSTVGPCVPWKCAPLPVKFGSAALHHDGSTPHPNQMVEGLPEKEALCRCTECWLVNPGLSRSGEGMSWFFLSLPKLLLKTQDYAGFFFFFLEGGLLEVMRPTESTLQPTWVSHSMSWETLGLFLWPAVLSIMNLYLMSSLHFLYLACVFVQLCSETE